MKPSLVKLRDHKPLVLSLTNEVVMDFTANALLAIGASPLMSESENEIAELVHLSQALSLNIGTLNQAQIQCMFAALHAIESQAVILDPVGAGASHLRTETSLNLLRTEKISILKGNASEIMALAQLPTKTKGVDSCYRAEQAVDAAQTLATKFNIIVVVTGAIDQIITSSQQASVQGGSPLMPYVTGMGCVAGALIASFASVEENRFLAAKVAMEYMARAGTAAEKNCQGPASFKLHFIDQLFSIANA